MDLQNMAKSGLKAMAVKKGVGMTGSLLKWGAIAGIGYLGYQYFKNKNAEHNMASTNSHSQSVES